MESITTYASVPAEKKPFYHLLYVQVLIAITLGVAVGLLFPDFATTPGVKALGDGFIKLIKMVIAPDHLLHRRVRHRACPGRAKVGRVGVKALIYFEVVSTFALVIGLVIGNVLQPGAGFSGTPDAAAVAKYVGADKQHSTVDFLLDVIPDSSGRRLRQGRHPAGAAVLHPDGFRHDGDGRARRQPARSSTRSPTRCSA